MAHHSMHTTPGEGQRVSSPSVQRDVHRAQQTVTEPSSQRQDRSHPGPSLLARCATLHPSTVPTLPVQLQAADQTVDQSAQSPSAIHEAAQRGLEGRHQRLPFLEQIQQSFGRHQVTHIKAHTDDCAKDGAQKMGALAFAQGDHIAFAGPPSLHTAAHEAAHVIQQQAGVQLLGGVGQVGDLYERNADQVADKVVRGQSAEALLTPFARSGASGSPSVGGVVQRAVGFEFQSRLKEGHVFSSQKLNFVTDELEEDKKLGDGFIAFENKQDHWHIENDHGDIEFVTHPPFAETKEGYESLLTCMTSMVTAAQAFEALGAEAAPNNRVNTDQAQELFGENVTKTEALESREAFGPIFLRMPSVSLLTHPQATGGVTLPALLTLMKKMSERTDVDGYEQNPPQRQPGIREQLLAEGLDAIGMSSKDYRAYALQQQRLVEAKVAAYQPEEEISQQTRGFLALVTTMIYGGAHMRNSQVQYAKDLLAIMPRSDYVQVFKGLPADDQAWFRGKLEDGSLAEALDWGKMDEPLVFHRLRHQSNANYNDLAKLTKKSWLATLSSANGPVDLLSAKSEGIGKVATANLDQAGQIGSSNALVNQGRRGVVVEMRALREAVPPEQWLALTKAWFRMTVALNRPDDLEDMFPELAPQVDPKQGKAVWKKLNQRYPYRNYQQPRLLGPPKVQNNPPNIDAL